MNGYVLAWGPCFACGTVFAFNPNKVPSHRRTPTGPREPICGTCMNEANRRRVVRGEPPHPILPDAYAPLPEAEL